jgi:hypothetical protein
MKSIIFIYLLTFADGSTKELPIPNGVYWQDNNDQEQLVTSAIVIGKREIEYETSDETEYDLYTLNDENKLEDLMSDEMLDYFDTMGEEEFEAYLKFMGIK